MDIWGIFRFLWDWGFRCSLVFRGFLGFGGFFTVGGFGWSVGVMGGVMFGVFLGFLGFFGQACCGQVVARGFGGEIPCIAGLFGCQGACFGVFWGVGCVVVWGVKSDTTLVVAIFNYLLGLCFGVVFWGISDILDKGLTVVFSSAWLFCGVGWVGAQYGPF